MTPAGDAAVPTSPARGRPGPGRPLRVCFLIDGLSAAGTEMQLLAMIRHLDRSRVEPSLVLLRGEDEESRGMEPTDCPVMRLGVGSLRHPATAAKAVRLARHLRRERIDVLQVHFPDSTYFGVPVGRLAGVPRVVRTRRNINHWMTPRDRRLGRLYNPLVHATLTNSESCRAAVLADDRPDPATVEVIENGIDLDRFGAIPAAGPDDPPTVGLLANLRPVKDPGLLVEAAGLLAASHPGARYRLAGEGELRPDLLRRAAELGVADRVELLGSIGDVPAFLAGLGVAVLCSRSEGMSNAVLEYMAAGRAIVATAVGGNAELIEDGASGLLVPPGDARALAGAIARLLDDRALAARLGAAARRRAVERHGFAAKARELEAFYLRLLGGRGGGR